MGFIPTDARWFIAELVIEIQVKGDQRNVVHRDLVLIEASSAEEAYQKSLQLGQDSNVSYENPDGGMVQVRFRGIADLDVIGPELKHGTELLFKEQVGMPEEKISQLIQPKEKLGAFSPIQPSLGPDYSSR